MMYYKSILICGGDKRQRYMYEYMREKGLDVDTFGLFYNDLEYIEDIKNYDVVILPLPVTKDGIYLNCERKVKLEDIFGILSKSQTVLGGMYDGIIDYSKCEKFQMRNALPTAEGAIAVAMDNTHITINGSRCAVFGYGRIGKILADMLKKLGADVTVYARNEKDLALAEIFGFGSKNINFVENLSDFDMIFNTVPKIIVDSEALGTTKKDVLLVELASKPYGIDLDAAEKLDRKCIVASGLPGKTAPKSAGKILYDVIMDVLGGIENGT